MGTVVAVVVGIVVAVVVVGIAVVVVAGIVVAIVFAEAVARLTLFVHSLPMVFEQSSLRVFQH